MIQHSQNLLFRFEEHLKCKQFLKPHERILVACSGGPDSVALFHLLQELARKNQWKLGLAHFNHRLRPGTAKKDESFVRALAQKSKVIFSGGEGDVNLEAKKGKISIEECAREMRYEFFLKTARTKRFSSIVLAHTQDDQAETVLMRIMQGTGLRGLLGIREKTRMGNVNLLRPLLSFTKKELLDYLAQKRISFRSDESNESLRFVRNRIRLKLIPILQRDFNPRLIEALSRLPSIVAEETALLSELEKTAWTKVLKRYSKRNVEFRRSVFLKYPAPLQFRVVEKALRKLDPRSGLSFDAWERLRRKLARARYRCSLPKDIDFALTPKTVIVYKKKKTGSEKGV